LRAREGDLLQTKDNFIFDVKGLSHPPSRTVAFPRFIPDPHGDRDFEGVTYKKLYQFSERYNFLEKQLPQYLNFDPIFGTLLSEVPNADIRRHLNPISHLELLRRKETNKLSVLENDALTLFGFVRETANIPWSMLGISGSLLAQLATPESDIDPIVYGQWSSEKVHDAMNLVFKDEKNLISSYTENQLRVLYDFRSKDTKMPFEAFKKVEKRKVLQGKFMQHDFYIRCVKDWGEITEHYGTRKFKNVGYSRIEAVISDDSEAIFTPCRYLLDRVNFIQGVKVKGLCEIVSFRGRFCEQARKGETVIAQGKIEKVEEKDGTFHFRILLGGQISDFMMLEGFPS
jgi:predicted nucleotidyltransferase